MRDVVQATRASIPVRSAVGLPGVSASTQELSQHSQLHASRHNLRIMVLLRRFEANLWTRSALNLIKGRMLGQHQRRVYDSQVVSGDLKLPLAGARRTTDEPF